MVFIRVRRAVPATAACIAVAVTLSRTSCSARPRRSLLTRHTAAAPREKGAKNCRAGCFHLLCRPTMLASRRYCRLAVARMIGAQTQVIKFSRRVEIFLIIVNFISTTATTVALPSSTNTTTTTTVTIIVTKNPIAIIITSVAVVEAILLRFMTTAAIKSVIVDLHRTAMSRKALSSISSALRRNASASHLFLSMAVPRGMLLQGGALIVVVVRSLL